MLLAQDTLEWVGWEGDLQREQDRKWGDSLRGRVMSQVTVSLHRITHFSPPKDLALVIPALHSLSHSFIFFIFVFQQERCFSGTLQVPHTGSKQQGPKAMRQGPALCHFTITLVGLCPPLFPPSPLQTCTKLVPAQCLPKGGPVGRTCRVWTTRLLQTHTASLTPRT